MTDKEKTLIELVNQAKNKLYNVKSELKNAEVKMEAQERLFQNAMNMMNLVKDYEEKEGMKEKFDKEMFERGMKNDIEKWNHFSLKKWKGYQVRMGA